MRVGLSIETDSPGGAETMLLELCRELLDRGHEVVAFGPVGGAGWLTARLADLGVDRELITVRGYRGTIQVAREMAGRLREREIDVLHSHEFAMAVLGALSARVAGCRHVITMHGGDYYARRYRRLLGLRLATALSDRTVVVSDALRDSMAEALRLSPWSLDVIHNGVRATDGGGAAARRSIGLEPGQVLLLAVGSLYPVKGHAVLLDALRSLDGDAPDLVLAIAGSGFEEANLRARIDRLELKRRVHLLGYRSDVRDLLDAADVFVMPSLSEGLPMAVIEAMLAGKAIVASDVGGIGELIPSADFGVLVPPGDVDALGEALSVVATDATLRRELGARAQKRALARFTASAMAERYLEVYGARAT